MWIAPKLARRDPLVKSLGTVGVALLLLGIMKERWDTSKPRSLVLPSKLFTHVPAAVVTTTQIIALGFAVCRGGRGQHVLEADGDRYRDASNRQRP